MSFKSLKTRIVQYKILEKYPDFLDLPWGEPLENWDQFYPNMVEYEIGLHRNEVKFLEYDNVVYAFKELPKKLASHEFTMLKELKELEIPVVNPVGYVQFKKENDEEYGIVITEYLEYSIPFRLLFFKPKLYRYQSKMIKSIANLIARLHIAKFYWGDCSLSNILFKRDAGELQAYLVDGETIQHYNSISDPRRQNDLDIMTENITGDLLDIEAQRKLPTELHFINTPELIQDSYYELWNTLTQEIKFPFQEKYRIGQKLEEIFNLGFTVKEYSLTPVEDGNILLLNTVVTEKFYYKTELKNLTSISAEETQAKIMFNNILEYKANLENKLDRILPLKVVAHQWYDSIFRHTLHQIGIDEDNINGPQIFCQLLEHKWLLSERNNEDVGYLRAITDYLQLDDEVKIEKDEAEITEPVKT